MKNWKRLLALVLSGAVALSLFACKPDGSTDDPGDPSGQVSSDVDPSASPEIVADLSQGPLEFAAGLSPDDVLLTVNGEEITADLMLYWLDYNCYMFMYQYGLYGATIADYGDMLLDEAVSLCASEVLLRQRAAELGCLPTDAQRQQAQDNIDADPNTIELFTTGYGLTDSSIQYLFLADAYYNNMLDAATHEPDELELDEYLDSQGVFSVKHILLKTVDDANQPLPEDKIAEQETKAGELLAQLQAADDMPAKFDELMNEYSEDGGLATNPDGYTFDSTASLVGGFREAALELEVGELSGIVETDYGYHIMLRMPVDEESRTNYASTFRATSLRDQIDQLVAEAEIVRADALTNLDVSDFYARMNAYLQALSEQLEGEG